MKKYALGFFLGAIVALPFAMWQGSVIGYDAAIQGQRIIDAENAARMDQLTAQAESALEDVRELRGTISVLASYYGADHAGRPMPEHGRLTASGETFNAWGMTAASRTLKRGTIVLLERDGRYAIARVNDYGPARRLAARQLDVSHAIARDLGMLTAGLAVLRMTVIGRPSAEN
jgi:rare lipoprotein A (peptidoglycan hydrolase)